MTRFLKFTVILLFVGISVPAFATTWYTLPGGGTRAQCTGTTHAIYPGSGSAQACGFANFFTMWTPNDGTGGGGTWIGAPGDTVIIDGCTAPPGEENPANPSCRVGWLISENGNSPNNVCPGVGPYACTNPTLPANTHIWGACVLTNTCHSGNVTTRANLTNIFGGFGLTWAINLAGAVNVDIEGIELNTHNSACSHHGSPQYPRACATSQPIDDYADNGFKTDNTTTGTFVDVVVDRFESSGLNGPIGGAIVFTRGNISFNAFAGWNFDDGSDTADAAGSSLTFSYLTMQGNGCKSQYPIVNTAWPAQVCWDVSSGGFGDGLSGQDTELDSLSCDHCVFGYMTKDAFIGPHTQVLHLSITNSVSIGSSGAQWKWGQAPSGTILFQNNLTVCNPYRQEETLPGAVQNFNLSTGLPGSYLSNFGRGNACFANLQRNGSVNNFYGNSIIGAQSIAYQLQCGYYSVGNVFNQETNCASVPNVFKDDLFLGYVDPSVGQPTAVYFAEDAYTFFTGSFNDEYGMKSGTGDTCGSTGNICVDPLMKSEPAQTWPGSETALDVFNPFVSNNSFYPTGSSPLIGAGTTLAGLTADYYGTTRPSPPTIGGVEPAGAPPSTPGVGFNGNVLIRGSVVIQ